MTPDGVLLLILAKRWRAGWVIGALLLIRLLWELLEAPVAVPARRDVSAVIWPLVPGILAIVVADTACSMFTDREVIAPANMTRRRLLHVAYAVGAVAVLVLLAGEVQRGVVARNGAALLGLGYGLISWAPRALGLMVLGMTPWAMWLLGSRSPGESPSDWAFLLHTVDSKSAFAAAIVASVVGVGSFLITRRTAAGGTGT